MMHRHNKARIGNFDVPVVRFRHVHYDLMSPLLPITWYRLLNICQIDSLDGVTPSRWSTVTPTPLSPLS